MAKKHKDSNEMEFQGQVVHWLNHYIQKHPSLGLEGATQEKPHKGGKRNDLIIWRDRAALVAFLTIELKTYNAHQRSDILCRRNPKRPVLAFAIFCIVEYARAGSLRDDARTASAVAERCNPEIGAPARHHKS
jgi:hypothetical protein